jgi:hypothetical protein
MGESLLEISEQIKTLKNAREILQNEYQKTEFHKKREENLDTFVPSSPEDEEIYKLLTAIHQIDLFIKKFQDKQFMILKKQEQQ